MTNWLLKEFSEERLIWIQALGVGYFPVEVLEGTYDQAYFDRYAAQADGQIGKALNGARCEVVSRHWGGGVLDVGIGSGAFLMARRAEGIETDKGADINPAGLDWLRERGMLSDLAAGCEAATFWDSLEHMERPDKALDRVSRIAFVSLPIFRDAAHVLRSKHFRPDEHFWYWTRAGFIAFADRCGFDVIEHNTMESLAGREDIETFVLERRA